MTNSQPLTQVLGPGDENRLESYLCRHSASSMFLRSNLQAAGIVDRGQVFGATWIAALENDEIVGVAAFCWDGVILLQSGNHTVTLTQAAVVAHPRKVRGFLGPWDMTTTALATPGLDHTAMQLQSREDLFFLHLDELQIPDLLQSGKAICQRISIMRLKPKNRKHSAVTAYWIPMTLWSTEKTYVRHQPSACACSPWSAVVTFCTVVTPYA